MARLHPLAVIALTAVTASLNLTSEATVLTQENLGDLAISVQQVNFRDAPFSSIAEFTVNRSLANAATGFTSGFVNVTNGSGEWVVRNLPLLPADIYDHNAITVRIDLGVAEGTLVSSMPLLVDYSPFPVTSFADVATTPWSVGQTMFAAGGVDGDTFTGYTSPPDLTAVDFTVGGLTFLSQYQQGHTNLQAALNQCATSAIANSLDWLRKTQGLPIPQPHVPGLKNDGSLVGALDAATDRSVTDCLPNLANPTARQKGCGVWPLDGKLKYISQTDDLKNRLVVKHQGGGRTGGIPDQELDGSKDLTRYGVTSKGKGSEVTFAFLLEEISAGEDVEIDLLYRKATTLADRVRAGSNTVKLSGKVGIGTEITIDAGTPDAETFKVTNVVENKDEHNNPDGTYTVTLSGNLAKDHNAGARVDGFNGRHYVNVTGAGYILGMPYITHISDGLQTDEDPEDKFLKKDNGNPIMSDDFEWMFGDWLVNSNAIADQAVSESVIPEPSTLALVGIGMLSLLGWRWRVPRRRHAAATGWRLACLALLPAFADPTDAGATIIELPFAQYGKVPNLCPPNPGICGAAAAINSFVFLRNTYPETYGSLIPDWDKDGDVDEDDQTESRDFLANGWSDTRTGMYGPDGGTPKSIWEYKNYWFDDFAPGRTHFSGQIHRDVKSWYRSGVLTGNKYPTWDFLWRELRDGEDIELLISPEDGGDGHVVTLSGLSFDDKDGDGGWDPAAIGLAKELANLIYLDPNDVTKKQQPTLSLDGGRLEFKWWGDGRVWYIEGAFTESVPEPATGWLVVSGIAAWAFLRKRRRLMNQRGQFSLAL